MLTAVDLTLVLESMYLQGYCLEHEAMAIFTFSTLRLKGLDPDSSDTV